MPSLTFVLPHWLYWAALAVFPLVATWLVQRQRSRPEAGRANLFLAYLFLVTAGFVGMHRFYLRSALGLVFIPIFLVVLWTSAEVRDAREEVSRTSFAAEQGTRMIARAEAGAKRQPEGAEQRVAEARAKAAPAQQELVAAQTDLADARRNARIAAIVLGLALLGDACLVPGLVRRVRARETLPPPLETHPMETAVPDNLPASPGSGGAFGLIDLVVRWAGELSAYWAVLAVFVYYYEVVGRYVFNSPTNWVHESMFLMFGIQYMLAGAYAYRDETHVRVDIVYSKLSRRGRAICDIITSAFFFLFTGTMLVTGWRFASDAMAVGESSFTEWGIQYWPVKLAIPLGAALLLLQGFSRLVRDIAVATGKAD
jgi:TRAP-type mannitol/chloroaromatic compound transport system permease small subunit